eukprot:scaffold41594_cov241-Skeletonema_marinoi.AAC.3
MLTTTSIDNNTTDYMNEISSEGLFFNTSLSTLDSVEESLLSKLRTSGDSNPRFYHTPLLKMTPNPTFYRHSPTKTPKLHAVHFRDSVNSVIIK